MEMWQIIKRFLIEMMPGMIKMVALAAVLGFLFNAMNADGLPVIRRPLRQTRRFAAKSSLVLTAQKQQPKIKTQSPSEPKQETATAQQKVVEQENPQKMREHKKDAASKADAVTKKHDEQLKNMAQALFTTLDDAKALFDDKSAIFIDARPKEDYQAEHITGAVSLFVDDANNVYEKTLGRTSKETTIITYCSDPECGDATKLADMLIAKGHKRVVILLDGLPGWKDAGYPTEVGTSAK